MAYTEVPVSVVIPTWERRDLLVRVLGALASQSVRPLEVIVVDNGSTDDSAGAAEDAGARVIQMGSNVGFAKAVNAGIREARGELVAIVNNDVDLHTDWLRHLCAALADEQTWFATGKILSAREPEKIDGAFDLIARSGMAWRAGYGRKDGPLWDQPRKMQFASMTAALFRRELFTKVGLLDEDYGSYYEDVDFGLRCALAECHGQYVPAAHAWHEGSATFGAWRAETVEALARNQRVLARKHFPAGLSWTVFAGQALWGFVAWRNGCWPAWWRGRREGRRAEVTILGPQPGLAEILAASETELLRLQRQSGIDTYWRWYQRLCR